MSTHEHNGIYTRKTIIVPADLAPTARAAAVALAGSAAAGMWETALSADGREPATHYVSSGAIELPFVAPLTDGALLFELAQRAGLTLDADQCAALVAGALISDDEPLTAIRDAGLQFVAASDADTP